MPSCLDLINMLEMTSPSSWFVSPMICFFRNLSNNSLMIFCSTSLNGISPLLQNSHGRVSNSISNPFSIMERIFVSDVIEFELSTATKFSGVFRNNENGELTLSFSTWFTVSVWTISSVGPSSLSSVTCWGVLGPSCLKKNCFSDIVLSDIYFDFETYYFETYYNRP